MTWISVTLTLIIMALLLGAAYGFAKGGDYTRSYTAGREVALQLESAAERDQRLRREIASAIPPQAALAPGVPIVIHVHLPSTIGHPQRQCPPVIDGDVVYELPAGPS